jgi:type IV pilus assembly protein PilW
MTYHKQLPEARRSRGFSLIELLVSITIGLVIVVAAGSAYLGASTAGKITDAQIRMNEDGQAALNILTQHLRMSGSNLNQPGRDPAFDRNPAFAATYVGGEKTPYASTAGITPVPTLSPYTILGCDGTLIATPPAATAMTALTCTAGANTLPDSIAISYEADVFNTEPAGTPPRPTDCIGNRLPTIAASFPLPTPVGSTSAAFSVAVNRFFIAPSGSVAAPSLFCVGNGGALAQPLVENVEDMQFTYGTVSSTASQRTDTVAGYLTANDVVTDANLALLLPEDRWGKVLSVRICVLVRSEARAAPDAASARYDDCQGNRDVAAPDLRLRRAYSTTVVLRNRRA